MESSIANKTKIRNEAVLLSAKLVSKSTPSGKPTFTEDADNYGFAWLPPLESFSTQEMKGVKYVDLLHQDPVFYNPGSYELMASCYSVEPYESIQLGTQPLSWDYTSLRDRRLSKLSTALTIKAVELCRNREYRQALSLLKTALEQDPKNVEAIIAFGACNANLGHLDIAVYQFQHALSLDPENGNAQKYLEQTSAKLNSIILPPASTQSGALANSSSSVLTMPSSNRSDSNWSESRDDMSRSGSEDGLSRVSEGKKRRKVHDDHEHGHKKKKSKKSKKKHSKKKHKRSSKKSTHRDERSSSESSSEDESQRSGHKGLDDQEEFHPILSRAKHKLWNL